MDTIPVELLTIIAVDDFDIFVALLRVPTIGTRLCAEYPQLVAKGKFIRIKNNGDNRYSFLNNQFHSFNDLPAIIYAGHSKQWYKYGKCHRRELPAYEYTTGNKAWFHEGELHRENDLHAVEYVNDRKEWFWHGKLHRGNDDLPALVERADGRKEWYWEGKFYRDDNQPIAECSDGTKFIRVDGHIVKQC